MVSRLYPAVLLLLSSTLISEQAVASVIFKPGAKARYESAAEEQMNGTAQELFEQAHDAESKGELSRAMRTYRAIYRRYPKDALAPAAVYRVAALQDRTRDYLKAADTYRLLVEQYPRSPHFSEAIEAQFRIGEMYLEGKKIKILGIPLKSSMESAITIFNAIIKTAPYGRYTARAQFNIGRAAEKQDNTPAAVVAYQAVVEKFPDDPVAVDAQYQLGYLWFTAARKGVRDAKAVENARTAFEDFLFRFPKSEKAAQARENLRLLDQKQTTDSFQIAKFYDKQKAYAAAVIYYNDVIRQQPGSTEADHAKQRVDQIRAKFGDAALQPAALTAATARKAPPKRTAANSEPRGPGRSGRSSGGPMPGSPGDSAPLPPPEYDESLPPPASLTPDGTTAPDSSPTPADKP
jgi:outer membrane protein assembly factor BamD